MSQKYEKLKTLLKELFQLDQPDLDFGFYRVMHARSAEVTQFLEKDLLPQVKAAFAQYQPADKAAIDKELAKAIENAQALGADPDTLPKVKELRARLADDAVDLDALEGDVYDHLFGFFRRYYSEGDFLSKRVYKPGVYAVPYEGEEVTLHWANADQYYIKTSEYLRDYAFRLRPDDEKNPMRVHFRLVDAAEGEHGNVKEQAGKERRFKLATGSIATVEDGELVIRFTYQPDPTKQKALNAAAETAVLSLADPSLAEWVKAIGAKHVRTDGTAAEATRLRVHLDRYTGRNTFDYFIHKDLGGFLRRELDFYIKNEVMHLDDVANESAPRVEQYLSKLKVIRRIAGKLIEFLAQLEDFQKKLWLKKKFVAETSWCVRLDLIPEEFYREIAAHDAQREEWVRLCAIEDLTSDASSPRYSVPLTPEFLKAHPSLVVDSRHFDAHFVSRLLDALSGLDALTDGVLLWSEASSALSLMRARYTHSIDCLYLDPPYNTGNDGFAYKDNYQHSSWLTMARDRIALGKHLTRDTGATFVSIGNEEIANLKSLMDTIFDESSDNNVIHWKKNQKPQNASRTISESAEYLLVYFNKKPIKLVRPMYGTREDAEGSFKPTPLFKFDGRQRRDQIVPSGTVVECENWQQGKIHGARNRLAYIEILDPPVVLDGVLQNDVRVRGEWCKTETNGEYQAVVAEGRLFVNRNGFPNEKAYRDEGSRNVHTNLWLDAGYNELGKATLDNLFGVMDLISYPKPVELCAEVLRCINEPSALALDFFAGSGTTGHAVITLNPAVPS